MIITNNCCRRRTYGNYSGFGFFVPFRPYGPRYYGRGGYYGGYDPSRPYKSGYRWL